MAAKRKSKLRDATEIISFIESFQLHMLQRPKMYASCPTSFEDQWVLLDGLRWNFLGNSRFDEPLRLFVENEYRNADNICGNLMNNGFHDELVLYEKLVETFRRYLVSVGRESKVPGPLEWATN